MAREKLGHMRQGRKFLSLSQQALFSTFYHFCRDPTVSDWARIHIYGEGVEKSKATLLAVGSYCLWPTPWVPPKTILCSPTVIFWLGSATLLSVLLAIEGHDTPYYILHCITPSFLFHCWVLSFTGAKLICGTPPPSVRCPCKPGNTTFHCRFSCALTSSFILSEAQGPHGPTLISLRLVPTDGSESQNRSQKLFLPFCAGLSVWIPSRTHEWDQMVFVFLHLIMAPCRIPPRPTHNVADTRHISSLTQYYLAVFAQTSLLNIYGCHRGCPGFPLL